jgi:hypothetical protein
MKEAQRHQRVAMSPPVLNQVGQRSNRLSDNVGGVKQFSSILQHALVEERHFALVEAVAFALPTKARS